MPPSPHEDWHPARLLPTVGLRGEEEKEQRATSSLLAVMHAVPQFARGLLSELGAPRGHVSTFTEVQVKDAAGNCMSRTGRFGPVSHLYPRPRLLPRSARLERRNP